MTEFAIRNLSVLDYAQGFTLWHYRVRGLPLANALAAGFFNPCSDMVAAQDMILVSAQDGGACVYVTAASEQGGVVVSVMSRTEP